FWCSPPRVSPDEAELRKHPEKATREESVEALSAEKWRFVRHSVVRDLERAWIARCVCNYSEAAAAAQRIVDETRLRPVLKPWRRLPVSESRCERQLDKGTERSNRARVG